MPSFLVSAAAVLVSANLIAASPTLQDCLASRGPQLAELSSCGHAGSLTECLSNLNTFKNDDVEVCYVNSGCSDAEAEIETRQVLSRCEQLLGTSGGDDLRKRHRGTLDDRAPITEAPTAIVTGAIPSQSLFARNDGKTGSDCFTSSTVSTSTCPLTTDKGHVSTLKCTPTMATQSQCLPGWLCSMDSRGESICMEKHDKLDIGGTILAIVFAVLITAGIGTLTFLCIRDKKQQKKLIAKAEAQALTRAETKKRKAAAQTKPEVTQDQAYEPMGAPPGQNPFDDRIQ